VSGGQLRGRTSVSGPGVGTFHTGRVGGVRKRDMLVQGCTQTRNRVRGWAKGGRGTCSTHGGGWGLGGAMCIAGSKGQDKEPNSLDPSTSTKARACFYPTRQGRITRGAHVGIEDAAHEDGGHASASRARARERSRGCAHGSCVLAGSSDCLSIPTIPFTRKVAVHSELRLRLARARLSEMNFPQD